MIQRPNTAKKKKKKKNDKSRNDDICSESEQVEKRKENKVVFLKQILGMVLKVVNVIYFWL